MWEHVGFFLFALGALGTVGCWFWLLVRACIEDPLSGALSWLVPPAILFFVVARWRKARTPTLFLLAFVAMCAAGCFLTPDDYISRGF